VFCFRGDTTVKRRTTCQVLPWIVVVLGLLFIDLFAAYVPAYAVSNRAKKLNVDGKSLMESGRMEEAREKFEAAIEDDFLYPEPYYNLGLLSRNEGRYEESLNYLNDARQLRPHEERYRAAIREHFILLGERAVKNRRYSEAEKNVRKVLSTTSQDPAALELLVRIYLKSGRTGNIATEAKTLETIVRQPVTDHSSRIVGTSLATLAVYHLETGWYLKADDEARRARDILPGNKYVEDSVLKASGRANPVITGLKKARHLIESNQPEKAEALFTQLTTKERDREALAYHIENLKKKARFKDFYQRAEEFYQTGDITNARKMLAQAQELSYDTASVTQVDQLMNKISPPESTPDKPIRKKSDTKKNSFSSLLYHGDRYFEEKRYKSALNCFYKALKLDPEAVSVKKKIQKIKKLLAYEKKLVTRLEQAKTLISNSKPGEALDILIEFENMERTFPELDGLLGSAYFQQGDLENASHYLGRHLDNYPKDYRALFHYGKLLYQQNQLEKSLDFYTKAQEALSEADEYEQKDALPFLPWEVKRVKKAMQLRKTKEYVKIGLLVVAIIGIIIIVAFLKSSIPRWKKKRALSRVHQYIAAKRWREAENAILQVLERPDLKLNEFKNHQNHLARVIFECGRAGECADICRELLKKDHRNQRLRVLLARCFIAMKTVSEEAMDMYRVLYKLEPNNQDLLEHMAQYYMEQDVVDEQAIEILRKMSRRDTDNVTILRKYVAVLAERGKTDEESLLAYSKLLQLEPGNTGVRETLVRGLVNSGNVEKAITEGRLLLEADPKNMLYHQLFIKAHLAQNQEKRLVLFYQDFLAIYPENSQIRKLVDDLTRKVPNEA